MTSDVNTDRSVAIALFEQSSLILKLTASATGQVSEHCIVPELNRIPTHGYTYLCLQFCPEDAML
jgi:hypothetical protein